MNPRFLRLLRLFFGLLGLIAILSQLQHNQSIGASTVNFFSFFTIQSNLLASAVLLKLALFPKHMSHRFTLVRGGATLYMTMTGIMYALLLSGLDASLQTTLPWVNSVLHYLLPAYMLVDWLIDRPGRLSFKVTRWWLAYPILYLLYSLVRGHFVSWYPYPFINPTSKGYIQVVINCLIIAPCVVIAAWLLTRFAAAKKTQ